MEPFKHLFAPITINQMTVKNRIFMAPMGTLLAAENNQITESLVAYYGARARGGAGLITTETAIIDEGGKYATFRNIALYSDEQIGGWRRLADEVHRHGAKLAAQLFHPATAAPSRYNENRSPVGASPVAYRRVNEIPRPLSAKEIQNYVENYADAAVRAQKAGCDAVEIHCCHRHGLLGNFLSPLHNKRVDAYGGNVEGRLKFPLEVVAKVRERTGPDFPIIVRLSATDMEPGGQSLTEAYYIAGRMEEVGADLLHFSNGTLEAGWNTIAPGGSGKAINAEIIAKIKRAVTIPVGVVGRINEPWTGELVLSLQKADVVYMGRALLCDPEFPNKAREGRIEDIRPCIGCLQCIGSVGADIGICCAMNPQVGRELEPPVKTAGRKRVLVVGGGPGGLEGAAVAGRMGHEVTLMEKSPRLGGQAYIAAFPPAKQDIAAGTKYLIQQAEKSGVRMELNREVTRKTVEDFAPDALIVATGGKPIQPGWLPAGQENILQAWDVLEGTCDTGRNVLVIGGSLVGCEAADFIAHPYRDRPLAGKQVTLIEMQDNLLAQDHSSSRSVLVRRLQEKGVRIITGAKVEEVFSDGVAFTRSGQREILRGMDTLVVAIGTQPEDALWRELEGLDIPARLIGDANRTGKIGDAVREGAQAARELSEEIDEVNQDA